MGGCLIGWLVDFWLRRNKEGIKNKWDNCIVAVNLKILNNAVIKLNKLGVIHKSDAWEFNWKNINADICQSSGQSKNIGTAYKSSSATGPRGKVRAAITKKLADQISETPEKIVTDDLMDPKITPTCRRKVQWDAGVPSYCTVPTKPLKVSLGLLWCFRKMSFSVTLSINYLIPSQSSQSNIGRNAHKTHRRFTTHQCDVNTDNLVNGIPGASAKLHKNLNKRREPVDLMAWRGWKLWKNNRNMSMATREHNYLLNLISGSTDTAQASPSWILDTSVYILGDWKQFHSTYSVAKAFEIGGHVAFGAQLM